MVSLNVEPNQAAEFFGRFERFGGNMQLLKQLLSDDDRMRSWVQSLLCKSADGASTITIPADATAEGLINEAKAEFEKEGIPFTHFDEDLLQLVRQDLELVRGKTCQVLVQNFGRDWEASEGRGWQKSIGADGNTAAYLVWVTKTKPTGWSVSIANADARLVRSQGGRLCAPYFHRDDTCRGFCLGGVWYGWDGRGSLVAFFAI